MTTHEAIAFLLGVVATVVLRALFAGAGGSDGAALARLERSRRWRGARPDPIWVRSGGRRGRAAAL